MAWVVLGEKNNLVELREIPSKNEEEGILTIGSFLTVKNNNGTKIVLRVEKTSQHEPYSPTALTAEMNLDGLLQDSRCFNIIHARRLKHISNRTDGKYDFIHPRSVAERSSIEEINSAMDIPLTGPRIFPATVFSGENNLIIGENNQFVSIRISDEVFWHQTVICGSTGSGKTVAMKYLAHHFVSELKGCVIALNVKGDDLLLMNMKSNETDDNIIKEWESLGLEPTGINNFAIYHPYGDKYRPLRVDKSRLHKITLKAYELDPESLLGLVREMMTDIASRWFPDIFRHWQNANKQKLYTFREFVEYFDQRHDRNFSTLDTNGIPGNQILPYGTYQNMSRAILENPLVFGHPFR